ncbi:hypothetical protein Desaf_3152 [Desulfocurvibacter africanus subsp. africanus str. Walvis Bay]|uniref:Uncharacterized protein n=2 Tax=Desulfocurvibacter africanus TaxID=873 RepID=F3Z3A9_DESAF|nr:hypothetical protein Desaf_3152 [Desulfocurvibacter africanus subsp. africanus str. Walvis Bay]
MLEEKHMPLSADLTALALWAALAALALLAWLSALGSPVLSASAEILADVRSKVFYHKFAQQMSKAGLIWLLVALLLTGLVMALRKAETSMLLSFLNEQPMLLLPLVIALALLISFALLHATTWRGLKESRGLHKLLGLLAALASLASIWFALSLCRLLAIQNRADPAIVIQDHFLIPATAPFWLLLGLVVMLALACAGGLGLAYTVMRRNKDDWGRDYYGFALRLGAGWTLLSLGLQAGFLGWLASVHLLAGLALAADPILRAGVIITASALLVAMLAYLFVWRSDTPLRHKPVIGLAVLFLLLMLAGLCLAGFQFLGQ